MDQYHSSINEYLENLACDLLNPSLNNTPYQIIRNNLNTNDIDLKVLYQGTALPLTIDVQYSMNFAKYGDVRIDMMSAGDLVDNQNTEIWQLNKYIANSDNHLSAFKSLFTITKYGKYFDGENKDILGIFYYFYNGKFDKKLDNFKNNKVDFYFFLPKRVVLNEIRHNPNITIKINDKKANDIDENHHSAFACLNVVALSKKYNLPIFSSLQELLDNFCNLLTNEINLRATHDC